MAERVGRRNLPTGNTVRAVGCKRRAQYLAQPVLTKSVQYGAMRLTNASADGYLFHNPLGSFARPWFAKTCARKSGLQRDEAIDEGGLEDIGVPYSLNKKQRWRLAELLKHAIASEVVCKYIRIIHILNQI